MTSISPNVVSAVKAVSPIWLETVRNGPEEFSKSRSVPHDIGDRFNYQMNSSSMIVNFGQSYYPSNPLSLQQYFSIVFGKGAVNRERVHPLAFCEDFDFLKEAKIKCTIGKTCENTPYVNVESQNLDMHDNEGEGQRNTFTKRGLQFMSSLISEKERMKAIMGMKLEDRILFSNVLDIIEREYLADKIEPRDWFYT